MENFTAKVTPGYPVPGATRLSEIGSAQVKRGRRQVCLAIRPSVVGGIQQAAVQLMFSPKHAVLMTDAGIPPSAKGRT